MFKIKIEKIVKPYKPKYKYALMQFPKEDITTIGIRPNYIRGIFNSQREAELAKEYFSDKMKASIFDDSLNYYQVVQILTDR